MLDLSSKISSFRKMVWANEKRKSEKQLYDSTETSSKALKEIKNKLENEYTRFIEKRKEFAKARKNEMVANISQHEKTLYNKFKEDLLNKLIEEIRTKLVEYSQSAEYKNKLKKDAMDTFIKLSKNDDSLILAVKKLDQDLFDIPTEIMDDKKIGGFVIKNKDLTYQYDFSLAKKLDSYKYEIGSDFYNKIAENYKKEMEDNDDSNN